MASKYTVHRSRLQRAQQGRVQLAIAILDHRRGPNLDEAIAWYRTNLNHSLFVVTEGEVETLVERYPEINFISFATWTTIGERINAVANECGANYFLITRSDLYLARFDGSRLFSTGYDRIAWAAVIANSHKEIVPSLRFPSLGGDPFGVDSDFPLLDEARAVRTLYPVMGLGLYDRAVFQRLRGFDEKIESDYYQLVDWGIRSALIGHRVLASSALLMQFIDRESVIEDRSERAGTNRCYTKALSFKKKKDGSITLQKPRRALFDREVWKGEVRSRLRWQVKEDLPSLVASWAKEGS
ncbi:MAG TPA: hypothetical protein PLX25_02280 [Sphaerochaeta sp.]|nr:hypothetical protein [Sphaerochaeta sp.]HPZ15471.1 hypothetical protein [Sphaerochaeta sp.]